MITFSRPLAALAALFLAGGSAALHAQIGSYYVGVDGLQTIASGTFAGQPNPNFGRLTLLFAHSYEDPNSNHYHSKGIYINSGDPANPTIITSASNFLPEGSRPPLLLSAGSGLYDGKWVTAPYTDPSDTNYPFSFLTLRPTDALAGFAPGSGEYVMHNSSGGRWAGSVFGGDIHLELVSLTAGLNIGSSTAFDIGLNQPGDDLHLGDGMFEFTPVFWADAEIAAGVYVAAFKLVDEDGLFGDSGIFEYRLEVIPEPSTYAALGLGLIVVVIFLRRRRA